MAWSDAVGWNKRRGWNVPAAAGGGGGSFATFDPNDFVVADTFGNACVSLDATKLIATQNHAGVEAQITATRFVSGLSHFEFTITTTGVSVGLEPAANKSGGYSSFLGGGGGGLGWLPDGRVFFGFGVLATVGTYGVSDTVYIEVDKPNNKAYFGVNSGARSVFVDISGMSGNLYPAADLGNTVNNSITANFGASSFVCPVTAGYGPIP